MATFYYHTEALARARGRSAVAAAAYRAGARLRDERRGRWYDFRARHGVAVSEIALPESAASWLGERAVLWNHAEACELRVNARVAREVRVALPRELTLEEQAALVRGFVACALLSEGVAVDWNIHLNRPYNPHAHLLVTVRRASGDGLGPKVPQLDTRAWLIGQRATWAAALNGALAAAGVPRQVDHRALRARGLARRPAPRLTLAALAQERRGLRTAAGDAWLAADRQRGRNRPSRARFAGTVYAVLAAHRPRLWARMEASRGRLERQLLRGRAPKPVVWGQALRYQGCYRGRDLRSGCAILETVRAYVLLPWALGRPVPHRGLHVQRRVRRTRWQMPAYEPLAPGRSRERSR